MKESLKTNFPETPSEVVTGERVLKLSCLAVYEVWKACPGKLLVSFYFDFTILRKKILCQRRFLLERPVKIFNLLLLSPKYRMRYRCTKTQDTVSQTILLITIPLKINFFSMQNAFDKYTFLFTQHVKEVLIYLFLNCYSCAIQIPISISVQGGVSQFKIKC